MSLAFLRRRFGFQFRGSDSRGLGTESGQVQVSLGAFPVMPADLRAIVGTNMTTNGSVGIGVVKALGSGCSNSNLNVNDAVLVAGIPSGSWSEIQTLTISSSSVFKIPSSLAPEDAAALPAVVSAYAVLEQQPALEPGDTVLLTCGESAVGLSLQALCKLRGFTAVAFPASLDSRDPKLKAAGRVKLALAQSSGSAVLALSRQLLPRGLLVCIACTEDRMEDTGGVTVAVSPLVFSGIDVRGWDFVAWSRLEQGLRIKTALASVLELVSQGKLNLSSLRGTVYPLEAQGQAIQAARKGTPVIITIPR